MSAQHDDRAGQEKLRAGQHLLERCDARWVRGDVAARHIGQLVHHAVDREAADRQEEEEEQFSFCMRERIIEYMVAYNHTLLPLGTWYVFLMQLGKAARTLVSCLWRSRKNPLFPDLLCLRFPATDVHCLMDVGAEDAGCAAPRLLVVLGFQGSPDDD